MSTTPENPGETCCTEVTVEEDHLIILPTNDQPVTQPDDSH